MTVKHLAFLLDSLNPAVNIFIIEDINEKERYGEIERVREKQKPTRIKHNFMKITARFWDISNKIYK